MHQEGGSVSVSTPSSIPDMLANARKAIALGTRGMGIWRQKKWGAVPGDFGGGTGGSAGINEAQKPIACLLKGSKLMARIGHQK